MRRVGVRGRRLRLLRRRFRLRRRSRRSPRLTSRRCAIPPNVILVGRVRSVDALAGAFASWSKMPVPRGQELVKSLGDESVADVVDLGQPIDGAISLGISRHGIEPQIAFSVPVRSFEQAAKTLGLDHKLVPGPNGQLEVKGIGNRRSRPGRGEHRRTTRRQRRGARLRPRACRAGAARLVCGPSAGVEPRPVFERNIPRDELDERPASRGAARAGEGGDRLAQEMRCRFFAWRAAWWAPGARRQQELIEASVGEVARPDRRRAKLTSRSTPRRQWRRRDRRASIIGNRSLFARATDAGRSRGRDPRRRSGTSPATRTPRSSCAGRSEALRPSSRAPRNVLVEVRPTRRRCPRRSARRCTISVVDRVLALHERARHLRQGLRRARPSRRRSKARRRSRRTTRHAAEADALSEQVLGWHLLPGERADREGRSDPQGLAPLWNRRRSRSGRSSSIGALLVQMRIAPTPPASLAEGYRPSRDRAAARDIEEVQHPRRKIPGSMGRSCSTSSPCRIRRAPGSASGSMAKLLAQKAAASLSSAPDGGDARQGAGRRERSA